MGARKKAVSEGLVTVYLTGTSHGAHRGEQRDVAPATAERLIRQGHAISQDEAEKRLEREICGS